MSNDEVRSRYGVISVIGLRHPFCIGHSGFVIFIHGSNSGGNFASKAIGGS